MFVLEIFRDALCLFHLDLVRGSIQRIVGFAAFRCPAHVSGRMRERNACFGQADKFDSLLRRDRQRQRFRIGQTDVFAGKNDNAPRDKAKIFASVQHFGEPVHRASFIRSAHAFDECADRVVVGVTRAIVHNRLLLNALLGNCEREVNHTIGIRLRCEDANFERV